MGVKVLKPKGRNRWYLSICHRGKRELRAVGGRDAAFAARKDVETAIGNGTFVFERDQVAAEEKDAAKDVTLKKYADETWMAGHVANNLKPSTARYYRMNLDAHLLPTLGARKLADITRQDVKALAFEKAEKGIAKSYVHGIVRTLSAILNHAVEDGIITANVATRPGRFVKVPKDREWIVALTPVEAKHFLDTAKKAAVRYYPLFAAALFTGARQGELLGLMWDDIDWIGKFIEIKRAKYMGEIQTPKSGKGRRVDMSDGLLGILKDHRKALAAEALKEGRPLSEWVFPSPTDKGSDGDNLRKVFHSVQKKAKMRKFRFHDLRHSYASWMIAGGESLAYVKEQMGHSSIKVTVDIYGHLVPGENREAANRISDKVLASGGKICEQDANNGAVEAIGYA